MWLCPFYLHVTEYIYVHTHTAPETQQHRAYGMIVSLLPFSLKEVDRGFWWSFKDEDILWVNKLLTKGQMLYCVCSALCVCSEYVSHAELSDPQNQKGEQWLPGPVGAGWGIVEAEF